MKINEDLGEEVAEQQVLIENIPINLVDTMATNQALDEAKKDNISSMSCTIQTQDMEIVRLNMELKQSRKKITSPIINTLLFENFLPCAQETKEELHIMQYEFYTKVEDFMDLFFKFLGYVEEGK